MNFAVPHSGKDFRISLGMLQKLSVYIVTKPGAFALVIDHALTLRRITPSYHNRVCSGAV